MYDLLVDDREIPDLLDDLAQLAAEHFRQDHDVHCGIILRREKSSIVMASSSARAAKMDEIQLGLGEGPCVEAMASQSLIRVTDVRTEVRWPAYMESVREHGLASALAVPLNLGGFGVAAMNFYTQYPGRFGDEDIAHAQYYTELIAKAIRIALRTAGHAETARHRRAAMEHRTPIDMAVGIIMAQNRCSQDEAFSILRRASSYRNVKIRHLADEIVASLGHGSPGTPFEP